MHYIRVKVVVKKRLCLCRNFRCEFTLSITRRAIDSPERFWSKMHPRYLLLHIAWFLCHYTQCKFKAVAFRSLCLLPNKIDFVFSWPKCVLNLLSAFGSHKREKSLSRWFSISVTFLCWKTIQVSSAESSESLITAWGKSFT